MTLNKAIETVRKRDPECYITRGLLEAAIREKKLGCVNVGTRKLVDVNKVMEYLSTACEIKEARTTVRRGRMHPDSTRRRGQKGTEDGEVLERTKVVGKHRETTERTPILRSFHSPSGLCFDHTGPE